MKTRALVMTAKEKLYEGVVVPTALYEVETWIVSEAGGKKSYVWNRCLLGMLAVSKWTVRNEDVRWRTEVERKLSDRMDQKVLGWYGNMIRMDEDHMTKVWKAEVSGVRVKGRPRKGCTEGVERTLGMRNLSVEHRKESARGRHKWRANVDG